jgi:cation diffusion facilitator family transporter
MKAPEDLSGLKLSVAVYIAVFALKLAVFFVSGVMVLLAEALHTLSDIIISIFLLAASVWSRKKPDAFHMYGHGRAQNVAALVAATLFISVTSLRLYEEAIPRLWHEASVDHRNLHLVLGVIGISMILAGAPLLQLLKSKARGAAAKAQLMELINDQLGLVAALLGTLFVMEGHPIADPIAAIVVATIIARSAIGLMRENWSFLMGRSPDPEVLAEIEQRARSVNGVLGVHGLRAEFVGPDTVCAGLHIVVRRGLAIEQADRIAEEVSRRLQEGSPRCESVVHMDPS